MKKILLALLLAAPLTASSSLITVNSFGNIQYWTGSGTNQAALVLDFGPPDTPSSIAWGYRWNGVTDTVEKMLFSLAGAISGSNAPSPLPGSDPRLTAVVSYFPGSTNYPAGYFVNTIVYDQTGLPQPWTQALRVIQDSDYFVDETFPSLYSLAGTGTWTGSSFLAATSGISQLTLKSGDWIAFAQTIATNSYAISQPKAAVPEPRSLLLLTLAVCVFFLYRRNQPRSS